MGGTSEIIGNVELDAGSGLPLARRVESGLGDLIRSGELPAGRKLPPTSELAELLGVSRQVAQDGLALLAERNLVRRKRGLGTMVLEPQSPITAGLLVFVGQQVSLTADVGWVIANDFLGVMERRGWDHRQYVRRRQSRPPGKLPINLIDDLLDGTLDVLAVGTVYESIVQANAPSSEVPVVHLNPSQNEARNAIQDVARWLWRQDCRRAGVVVQSVAEAEHVLSYFNEAAAEFLIEVPSEWTFPGCQSSIGVGRRLFHDLYDTDEEPDGLLIMDDMIAYGLIEEARRADYRLDLSSTVVMVNKGSSLYIPPECPRIELNWGAVIKHELDHWYRDHRGLGPVSREKASFYEFAPNGLDFDQEGKRPGMDDVALVK